MSHYFHGMRHQRSIFSVLVLVPGLCMASSFAGPDQDICGTATTLEADPLDTGESGFWTLVQGNASFTNANSPTSGVTQLSFGENVLMWTLISSTGATTDLVSIWAYDASMPMANAGPDQTVPAWPGTAQLNGSTPIAPAVCFWTVISGTCSITEPTNPNTTVSSIGGTSVVQWSCDNGPCGISSDEIVLDVVVGVAESAGANASMWYDTYGHRLIFEQKGPSMSITLFDRQGRVLEQLTTPVGAGTWDLSQLPAGMYVVQVRSNDEYTTHRFVMSK